jgi:hypothetical protein
MSRFAITALLAAAPLLLASLQAQTTAAPTWHNNLATARQLAAKQQAPLLVTFRCER